MVTAVLAAVVAAAVVGAAAAVLLTRVLRAQLEREAQVQDVREDAVRHTLAELGQRLERVGDTVARLREDRAGQHGQLLERVAEAHRVTEALRTTTEGLQRALANPQARGQWGERMCDDVLRAAARA